MLDQCNVNAHILYSLCTDNTLLKRNEFILDLCMALAKPYKLAERLKIPTLRLPVRLKIMHFIEYEGRPEEQKFSRSIANKCYGEI